MSVSTLNASIFLQGTQEEKESFAHDFLREFQSRGFVKLKGHDIPVKSIQQIFEWHRRFFALSDDVKSRLQFPGTGPPRGYSFPGQEGLWRFSSKNAGNSEAHELREHFDVGPQAARQFVTPWPQEDELPGFQTFITDFYTACQSFCLRMAGALEMAAGLSQEAITSQCSPAGSEIRLNYYPAVRGHDVQTENVRRIWPHTDTGVFTLLWQEGAGGLQVEDRSKAPDTFTAIESDSLSEPIVNVAETLEQWTNGLLPACVHQVKLPVGCDLPERRSVAFFFKPNLNASVAPLPLFVTPESPAKYEDMTFLEHNKRKHSTYYGLKDRGSE